MFDSFQYPPPPIISELACTWVSVLLLAKKVSWDNTAQITGVSFFDYSPDIRWECRTRPRLKKKQIQFFIAAVLLKSKSLRRKFLKRLCSQGHLHRFHCRFYPNLVTCNLHPPASSPPSHNSYQLGEMGRKPSNRILSNCCSWCVRVV